jgi:hypothetical protein
MQGMFELQYQRALSSGNTAHSRMYMHFQKCLSFILGTAPLALLFRGRSKKNVDEWLPSMVAEDE